MPYGIYDLAANSGWVRVGTDHDTAAFAVESIRRRRKGRGREDLCGRPALGDVVVRYGKGRGKVFRALARPVASVPILRYAEESSRFMACSVMLSSFAATAIGWP